MIFSTIQILHEINFEDSRSEKSAILPYLDPLNFNFHEFWIWLNFSLQKMQKIIEIKIQSLLISRKIWLAEK